MLQAAAIDGRDLELATMRKVSRRLIPYLLVLYVACYLDRINIGFAQLQMKSALGFGDTVYGLGASIFFLGYFLFEVPSNLILARVGARVWIARIMITWGLVSSAMAIVRTPSEFYAFRFLLGIAEAGFFPGIIYYLSAWVPSAARASAISRFMTALALSGVIGGLLSAVLFRLDGVSGLRGWQWIFVAEGVPAVVLGVATLWFLPDRPAEAKWLAPAERECLDRIIRSERADIARRGHISLRRAMLHPTVLRLGILAFMLNVAVYSISFWLPQIVGSLSRQSNIEVALLSSIPYVAAAMAMVAVGAHSDRNRERCVHIAGAVLVGAAGLGATVAARTPVAGLITLSVAAMGVFSAIPVFWSLPTTFLSGFAAAGAIALINSLGSLGGLFGPSLVGRVRDLTGGFAGSLTSIAVVLVASAALAVSLRQSPANEDDLSVRHLEPSGSNARSRA
jgi:ACS family tartrate transporter-like MFS transporter